MPRSKSEQTSPLVASKAGRILRNRKASKKYKSVAASALTQARDKKAGSNKKRDGISFCSLKVIEVTERRKKKR